MFGTMETEPKTNVQVDDDTVDQSLGEAVAMGAAEFAEADKKTGTADDRADMFRMGKIQELRVNGVDDPERRPRS